MKSPNSLLLQTLSALLISWTAFGAAQAQDAPPLAPQDFASGARLEGTNTGAPLYRLDLPLEVFTGTAWPDLRDVRVFNSQGEVVPFWLLQPETRTAQTKSVPLSLFELPRQNAADKQGKVVVRTGRRQVEIALPESESGEARAAGATYLLELRDRDLPPVSQLHFEWQRPPGNWQGRVRILASHDLDDWYPIGGGTLTDLRSDQGDLRIADIALSTGSARPYLLVRFDGEAPVLTGATIRYAESAPAAEPLSLVMQARKVSATEYEYALPHALPLAALRIRLPEPNAVASVELATRGAEKEAWRPLGTPMLYRYNARGEDQTQDDIDARGRIVRAVRIVARGAGWGEGAPNVRALIEPRVLVFNARGKEPFMLAWGARAAGAAAMTGAIPGLGADRSAANLADARLGEAVRLGGPERLSAQSPAERRAGWHKALLWIVLIAGAAGLAWLALRLLREAARGRPPQS